MMVAMRHQSVPLCAGVLIFSYICMASATFKEPSHQAATPFTSLIHSIRNILQSDAAPGSTSTTRPRPSTAPTPKHTSLSAKICLDTTYEVGGTRFDVGSFNTKLTAANVDPGVNRKIKNRTFLLATSASIAIRQQQLGTISPANANAITRTHVLTGRAGYKEFAKGQLVLTTLLGNSTRAITAPMVCDPTSQDPVLLSFYITQENEYVVEAPGSSASILGAHDVAICEGNRLHAVDDLLFPCCFTIDSLRNRSRLAPMLPTLRPPPATAAALAAIPPVVQTGKGPKTAAKAASPKASTALDPAAVLRTLRGKILQLLQADENSILAAFVPTVTTLPPSLAALLSPLPSASRDTLLTRLAQYHVSVDNLRLKNLVSAATPIAVTTLKPGSGFGVVDSAEACSGLLSVSFSQVPTALSASAGPTYAPARRITITADRSTATVLSHYQLCDSPVNSGRVLYFLDALLLPCDLAPDAVAPAGVPRTATPSNGPATPLPTTPANPTTASPPTGVDHGFGSIAPIGPFGNGTAATGAYRSGAAMVEQGAAGWVVGLVLGLAIAMAVA